MDLGETPAVRHNARPNSAHRARSAARGPRRGPASISRATTETQTNHTREWSSYLAAREPDGADRLAEAPDHLCCKPIALNIPREVVAVTRDATRRLGVG